VGEAGTARQPLGPRLTVAFDLARTHHLHQTRKGDDGVPYLSHLMGVAAIALEHGATEDEAIAALLHDVVEDGGGQQALAEIRERFGDDVAEIVWACTDTDAEPKPPWIERKRHYVAALPGKPEPALLVSASDKLYNARAILDDLRAIGDEAWQRFHVTDPAQQLWYYRSLADIFNERAATDAPRIERLAAELERAVAELERSCSG
jgi:GTP pyrophosphokinase